MKFFRRICSLKCTCYAFPFNFFRFLLSKIRFFDEDVVADAKFRMLAWRQVFLAGCPRSHGSAYSRRSTFESAYLLSFSHLALFLSLNVLLTSRNLCVTFASMQGRGVACVSTGESRSVFDMLTSLLSIQMRQVGSVVWQNCV